MKKYIHALITNHDQYMVSIFDGNEFNENNKEKIFSRFRLALNYLINEGFVIQNTHGKYSDADIWFIKEVTNDSDSHVKNKRGVNDCLRNIECECPNCIGQIF